MLPTRISRAHHVQVLSRDLQFTPLLTVLGLRFTLKAMVSCPQSRKYYIVDTCISKQSRSLKNDKRRRAASDCVKC